MSSSQQLSCRLHQRSQTDEDTSFVSAQVFTTPAVSPRSLSSSPSISSNEMLSAVTTTREPIAGSLSGEAVVAADSSSTVTTEADTSSTVTPAAITQRSFEVDFSILYYHSSNCDADMVIDDGSTPWFGSRTTPIIYNHKYSFVKTFLKPQLLHAKRYYERSILKRKQNQKSLSLMSTLSTISSTQQQHVSTQQILLQNCNMDGLLIKPTNISRVFVEAWLRSIFVYFTQPPTSSVKTTIQSNNKITNDNVRSSSSGNMFSSFDDTVRCTHVQPCLYLIRKLLMWYFLPNLAKERKRQQWSSSISLSSSSSLSSVQEMNPLCDTTTTTNDRKNLNCIQCRRLDTTITSTTTTDMSLANLPDDIWTCIASYLTIDDMYSVTLTCSKLRHTVRSQWSDIRTLCIPRPLIESLNGLATWLHLDESNVLFLNQQRAVIRHPASGKYVGAMSVGTCKYNKDRNILQHVDSGQVISWKDVQFQDLKSKQVTSTIRELGMHRYAYELSSIEVGYLFEQYYFMSITFNPGCKTVNNFDNLHDETQTSSTNESQLEQQK